jgi:hypothetical protein
MVVLGGAMSIASNHLLPAINQMVEERALTEACSQTCIVPSAFGPDASVIGAVALVVTAIFSEPSLVEPPSGLGMRLPKGNGTKDRGL